MARATGETLNDLAGGLLDASVLESLNCGIGSRNIAFATVWSQSQSRIDNQDEAWSLQEDAVAGGSRVHR